MTATSVNSPGGNRALLREIDQSIAEAVSASSSRCSDALLEMRAACARESLDPAQLVHVFLQNRKQLARYDYLRTHRFRRRLENSYEIVIDSHGLQERVPLNLEWPSLAKVMHQARRDYFEHHSADWDSIQLSLQPRR